MNPDEARCREHILALHAAGKSFARIAKEGHFPKDREILKALGLLQRRKRTEIQKRISEMARETKKAVLVKK